MRAWLLKPFSPSFLKPLVAFLVFLVIWEITVRAGVFPEFTVASPTQVAAYMAENPGALLRQGWPTLRVALIAFGLAVFFGVLLGIVVSESRLLRDSLMPLMIISQVIPSIAIAPIFVLILGFGDSPRIATALLIAFFPILVNTLSGLELRDESMTNLSRSIGSSRFQTLVYFSFPNALPMIFAGARVSVTLAVIGAVVGEFVTASSGLGYMVLQGASTLNPQMVFSALVGLAIGGIVLYGAVCLVQYLTVPWTRPLGK